MAVLASRRRHARAVDARRNPYVPCGDSLVDRRTPSAVLQRDLTAFHPLPSLVSGGYRVARDS